MSLTLNIILIGVGWLLAAGSGVLWFRENPGRPLRWNHPKPSWRSTALHIAGIAVALYGWSNLQLDHRWNIRWVVVVAVFPLSVIAGVVPRIVRWRQLRATTPHPTSIASSAAVPPTG